MISARIYIAAALVMLASFGITHAEGQADSLVAVVHSGNHEKSLNAQKLQNIYMGRVTFWGDGTPITAYVRPASTPAGKLFLKSILKMTPARFKHHWASKRLSGQGMGLKEIKDPRKMVAKVAHTPGGIGVVLASEVQGLHSDAVRVVAIK